MGSLTDYERGFLAGLVIGEGHFGVSRGTPQFVLGMNVRHAVLLQHVQDLLPGSRLYGPYHHNGRYFLRLMLRGAALKSCLDIFDSLSLDRWCPHGGPALRSDADSRDSGTHTALEDRFMIFISLDAPTDRFMIFIVDARI